MNKCVLRIGNSREIKRGVVSSILDFNRRLWTCEGLNCHVKLLV